MDGRKITEIPVVWTWSSVTPGCLQVRWNRLYVEFLRYIIIRFNHGYTNHQNEFRSTKPSNFLHRAKPGSCDLLRIRVSHTTRLRKTGSSGHTDFKFPLSHTFQSSLLCEAKCHNTVNTNLSCKQSQAPTYSKHTVCANCPFTQQILTTYSTTYQTYCKCWWSFSCQQGHTWSPSSRFREQCISLHSIPTVLCRHYAAF